jgi:Holliday junction resolvasome RuvABC endonuclease subunit
MVIMGIDASYTRTGLAIAEDGKLKIVKSIKFKGLKKKPEKRANLKMKVENYIKKYQPEMIVVERTRQFSTNDKSFIAMNMIKTGISILTCIIDVAYANGIKVYSVDTRAWKSAVIGTSKPKDGDKKLPGLEFVKSLGFDVYDDDDAADGACIALFYWYSMRKNGEKRTWDLLKLEE